MTRQTPDPAGLRVEQLEDRLTPAGAYIPAGEFNWTQYSPTGELAQLVWSGQTLVYRTRAANAWQEERVVTAGTFTQGQYDTRDQVQRATQSAQLVFTSDGTAHVLFLDPQWVSSSNGYQTVVRDYARIGGQWRLAGSVTAPWLSTWGPSNLVAEAGANNAIHLLFAETYNPATGVGNVGTGILWYATNKAGAWKFDRVADTADLKQDVWFSGGRWAPRFLSLAVDSKNNAHVTYTPQFYIAGAFSTVYSELKYATNKTGAWASQTVIAPQDGTADAGLGASVAVGPNDQVAIASYYVDRFNTGSPQKSQLLYHVPKATGGWTTTTVMDAPDGYAAADGASFTGFAPQLYFDNAGRANIVFSDEAGQHLPVTYANEFAGQIRVATLNAGKWTTSTVFRQTNPIVNQLFYPVAATYNGQTTFAGLQVASRVDGNQNPTGSDFALVDVNAPRGAAKPTTPAAPASPPSGSTPAPTQTVVNAPGPTPAVNTPPASAAPPSAAAMAVGTDAGPVSTVVVYRSDGSVSFTITPFGSGYTGGARVARADVTGDGTPDIIVGSGGQIAARVRIWDGQTQRLIFDQVPFGNFTGGVVVAAGDINGDGYADVAIGPDVGGGPRIQMWSGRTMQLLTPDFLGLPYPDFRGGLRLAVADVNADGFADVLVAPGEGGGPRVTAYDGKAFATGKTPTTLVNDFFVFDDSLRTGLNLAAGDVDGDGYADIVAGSGAGGAPRVRVVSGRALISGMGAVAIADYYADNPADRGGVRVGFTKNDGDAKADLVTGSGDSAQVGVFTGAAVSTGATPTPAEWFDAFSLTGTGIFVG